MLLEKKRVFGGCFFSGCFSKRSTADGPQKVDLVGAGGGGGAAPDGDPISARVAELVDGAVQGRGCEAGFLREFAGGDADGVVRWLGFGGEEKGETEGGGLEAERDGLQRGGGVLRFR